MISAEVLLRLGRVGVKPRKLELKRRIEEDTAQSVQFRLLQCFFGRSIRGTFTRSIEGGVFSFLRFFRCYEKERSALHFQAPDAIA